MEARSREAMKFAILMDIIKANLGLSPNVPDPVPSHPSQSCPPTTPPTIIPTIPPPLMSISNFPNLQSDTTSPPRKSRRKDIIFDLSDRKFENIFDKQKLNWPRFYIISKKEGDFSQMSPFLYCQQIINSIGKPKSVQKMSSGALNIEAANAAQAKLLKEVKMIGDYEVNVEPNKRLNTSKGVVVCRDFMVCSEEEIKIGMADQGVIDVKRINRRQGGTLVATASLILTFDKPEIPEQIEAAYYKLKVRKYIPSPMRCFKCLKFGHTSYRCRSAGQMCACGLLVHENTPCQEPPVCVNCADPHSSRSPDCIIYKEEKEVQKVKILQNMPYHEAKELVRSKYFVRPERSYAATAKVKQIEKRDWQKELRPFIFSGNQGPSKPVWATQEPRNDKSNPTPTPPTGVGIIPSPDGQGITQASLPNNPYAARPTSSRLPPRSPPRKERAPRHPPAIKTLPRTRPIQKERLEEMTGQVLVNPNTNPQQPRVDPINWVSSREEHGSDSETGDSNRTVLTDNCQAPTERPVVRRKRKGMTKPPKK